MGKGRFVQEIHAVNVGTSGFIADYSDAFAGTVTTDVINMANYDKATWIIAKGAGVTGTTLLQVESCDDTTPSNTTAIAFDYWTQTTSDTRSDKATAASTGLTTSAGANAVYFVEVNSSELSSTNQYVRLKATEVVNDPQNAAVVCILSGARNIHEVPQTAIS